MSVRRGATLSDWKFDWKTWPWRHLFGEGRKPAKSSRIYRRPYPSVIDGYENASRRPGAERARAEVLVEDGIVLGGTWYRYWQRWSRKRRAARKRRRGWA